jgi:hypothetical protein
MPGEQVQVKFTKAPNHQALICSAITAPDGSFGCNGIIPGNSAGLWSGAHDITAKGKTSGTKAVALFTVHS